MCVQLGLGHIQVVDAACQLELGCVCFQPQMLNLGRGRSRGVLIAGCYG